MGLYAALLRGINVGGHRVKMDRLRALFGEMGFQDVGTVIASGNVTFRAPGQDPEAVRETIESALRTALGYEVATFLRTADQLRASLATRSPASTPLGVAKAGAGTLAADVEGRAEYVVFLREAPDEALRARLAAVESPQDRFGYGPREVFWSIQDKLSSSPLFGTGIERVLAAPSTMRNRATVGKILKKLDEAGAGS